MINVDVECPVNRGETQQWGFSCQQHWDLLIPRALLMHYPMPITTFTKDPRQGPWSQCQFLQHICGPTLGQTHPELGSTTGAGLVWLLCIQSQLWHPENGLRPLILYRSWGVFGFFQGKKNETWDTMEKTFYCHERILLVSFSPQKISKKFFPRGIFSHAGCREVVSSTVVCCHKCHKCVPMCTRGNILMASVITGTIATLSTPLVVLCSPLLISVNMSRSPPCMFEHMLWVDLHEISELQKIQLWTGSSSAQDPRS